MEHYATPDIFTLWELFHKRILPAWPPFSATSAPAAGSRRGSRGWTPPPRSCNSGEPACPWPTSTAIPAYANPNRETPADLNAAWGYRTPKNKSPKAEKGKKDLFFGYDADVISDAHYGLPFYLSVRPANLNEGPRLRADLDAALQLHPWLKPSVLTADKAYHAGYNFSYLVNQGIQPIISIPRPPKDKKPARGCTKGCTA